jgi:mRNA-decapping enzyme subunit 2
VCSAVLFWTSTMKDLRSGCIILNKNNREILCVKNRLSNTWGFPKGHKELKESIRECALRELLEESGYVLDSGALDTAKLITYKNRSRTYFFFMVSVESLELLHKKQDHIIDTKEISGVAWLSLKDLKSKNLSKVTQYCVDKLPCLLQY